MTTRFENGIVVTLGNENRVLWNATVVIDGELVAAIGSSAEMKHRYPDAESIDCSGKIILPGFICAHHHFYSTMARGMAIPGEPAKNFVEILEKLWWKVDRALDEEDILLSAQLPLIDCIRNGTTTVIDHHASPSMRDGSLDLIETAVRQAGLRASLCYEVSDRNVIGGGIAENERFIKKVGRGDGQIAAMMGLHASFTLSDETLEKCIGIAKESNVGCHIHVAEDLSDREDSLKKYNTTIVNRLHKMGATGKKSIFVHCVHIDENEMDVVAQTGTIIVHNPESNMNNAVVAPKSLKCLKKMCSLALAPMAWVPICSPKCAVPTSCIVSRTMTRALLSWRPHKCSFKITRRLESVSLACDWVKLLKVFPPTWPSLTIVRQPRLARPISWVISSLGWWMPS